jgi:hypothetical protein
VEAQSKVFAGELPDGNWEIGEGWLASLVVLVQGNREKCALRRVDCQAIRRAKYCQDICNLSDIMHRRVYKEDRDVGVEP